MRIMALDYGSKRCGLATTDPLRIIATALTTVTTPELLSFFERYLSQEPVSTLLVGQVTRADGSPGALEGEIQDFLQEFQKRFPQIEVVRQDEAYTSKLAEESIRFSVAKKKKRQDKALIDQVSAVILLQQYLGHV